MENYIVTLFFLSIFIIILLSKLLSKSKQLPPGPKSLPIIGSILELGDKPDRAIAELSKRYGPIMSIKLGSRMIIVTSSPKVAQEMFLRHDLAFSSRAVPHAGAVGNHDKFSMVWLPVSPKWWDLRKIATIQLFTTHTLDASQIIRQKKVNELIDYARPCGKNGMPIDIGKAGFTTSLNLLSNTFFSMDLASPCLVRWGAHCALGRSLCATAQARPSVQLASRPHCIFDIFLRV
ncbi:Geraniol 8-hydroxylase [Bienertia sinuspersici]